MPKTWAFAVKAVFHRFFVRFQYNYLNSLDKECEITFLNYGFVELDPEAPMLQLAPEDEENRYCIQLYHHVVQTVPLKDKEVLEVGSGRGGGASYMARYYEPKRLVGLDYSGRSVSACKRLYRFANLEFNKGNAEKLPFNDASFDAVVNVESSHCYPYMRRFLAEVHRVLRPGGHFLYTDFRTVGAWPQVNHQFDKSGLHLVRKQDITPNVLEALNRDSERKAAMIDRKVKEFQKAPIRNFAAIKGSVFYEQINNGLVRYWSYVLRKPE